MRIAMIVILLQFFALFMPFVIHDELEFSWLGMPTEVSFWVFFMIATISFLVMAFYVGEHDKPKEDE